MSEALFPFPAYVPLSAPMPSRLFVEPCRGPFRRLSASGSSCSWAAREWCNISSRRRANSALAVLEAIASPEAREILKTLARESPLTIQTWRRRDQTG